jgi:hypothetical protein
VPAERRGQRPSVRSDLAHQEGIGVQPDELFVIQPARSSSVYPTSLMRPAPLVPLRDHDDDRDTQSRSKCGPLLESRSGPFLVSGEVVDRSHLSKKTVNHHLTLPGAMLNAARNLGRLAVAPRLRKPKNQALRKRLQLCSAWEQGAKHTWSDWSASWSARPRAA